MLFSKGPKEEDIKHVSNDNKKDISDAKASKNLVDAYSKYRSAKKAEKEAAERKRQEEIRRKKAKDTRVGIIALFLLAALIIFLNIDSNKTNSATNKKTNTSTELSHEADTSSSDDETVEDAELVITEPLVVTAEDLPTSESKKYDYGYIQVKARPFAHFNDGGWRFTVLFEDGSDGGPQIILDSEDLNVVEDYKEIFEECRNSKDYEDYIFTFVGNASWAPLREGSGGGNSGFRFSLEKTVEIVYSPEKD